MTVETSLQEARQKMDRAVEALHENLAGIRTGRAHPSVLARVIVDYYGSEVPMNQLASFSVPEPRTLVVQPFDKGAMGAMEKAILASELGITPSNDGQVIRLSFPMLTEERRKEMTKNVHSRGEEGRVAVRNIRRHHKEELEKLEREHTISEDDLKRAEKELQALTDSHVAQIDASVVHKETELMEV